jgi:hypothetical protein
VVEEETWGTAQSTKQLDHHAAEPASEQDLLGQPEADKGAVETKNPQLVVLQLECQVYLQTFKRKHELWVKL